MSTLENAINFVQSSLHRNKYSMGFDSGKYKWYVYVNRDYLNLNKFYFSSPNIFSLVEMKKDIMEYLYVD